MAKIGDNLLHTQSSPNIFLHALANVPCQLLAGLGVLFLAVFQQEVQQLCDDLRQR